MANFEEYKDIQLQNLGKRLKDLRKAKGYTNYEQFAFDNEIPRAQYGGCIETDLIWNFTK